MNILVFECFSSRHRQNEEPPGDGGVGEMGGGGDAGRGVKLVLAKLKINFK